MSKLIETKKDVIKITRSIIELLVVLFLVFLMVRALFLFSEYKPYDKTDKSIVSGEDHGFIVLSYLGVDREGTNTLISTENLDEQLKALSDNGYITISQQDIVDYYEKGTPLPDKALYLMFEDGRNDTAVFAQSIMENYNYKASIYSYAEKFVERDSKFLMPDDLMDLEDSGFWEQGTNGYRLQYINVFDRYGRFIGEISSNEYSAMAQYLGKDYNQYLMDYIRDENKLPVETISSMKRRVSGEYGLMRDMYMNEMGKVPRAYVLMHSNTGNFGNNENVSAANAEMMSRMFDMNFNREGGSFNNSENSIYDLTRMQPQAYWSANHVIMRLRDDIPEDDREGIKFVDGDLSAKSHWEELYGISQFIPKKERIIVTSDPADCGIIKYKDEDFKDGSIELTLNGNVLGEQTIYLRANDELSEYVAVSIKDNIFYVVENGEELFKEDLFDFDGKEKISVDEDKRDALAGEYRALANNADTFDETKAYRELQFKAEAQKAKSVEEGAKEYRPAFQINERGSRRLKISLNMDLLTVEVDGNIICENVTVSRKDKGCIALRAAYSGDGYSQRSISDDVYDGIFDRITVTGTSTEAGSAASERVLFTNRATGFGKAWNTVKLYFNKVVNWFIKNL